MRYWKAGVGCLDQSMHQCAWKFFSPGWAVPMHLIPHVEASNANPALDLKTLNRELISGKKGLKGIFFIHAK